MEYIKDNEKWQPTREEYFKLEEIWRIVIFTCIMLGSVW